MDIKVTVFKSEAGKNRMVFEAKQVKSTELETAMSAAFQGMKSLDGEVFIPSHGSQAFSTDTCKLIKEVEDIGEAFSDVEVVEEACPDLIGERDEILNAKVAESADKELIKFLDKVSDLPEENAAVVDKKTTKSLKTINVSEATGEFSRDTTIASKGETSNQDHLKQMVEGVTKKVLENQKAGKSHIAIKPKGKKKPFTVPVKKKDEFTITEAFINIQPVHKLRKAVADTKWLNIPHYSKLLAKDLRAKMHEGLKVRRDRLEKGDDSLVIVE